MNIPQGFAQVFPYIFAGSPESYVTFLKTAFGAEEVGRTVAPDGEIANCRIRIGEATLMVSQASRAFPPSRAAMYLYVSSADNALKCAVDAGATIVMGVADMPYGDRQAGVADPEGNIWWLSQRLVDGPYD